MKPFSHRRMAIDTAALAAISLAIAFASHRWLFMTIFVIKVILARFALIYRETRREGKSFGTEIVFFAICTILGSANDWISVCNRKIYDYLVPHEFFFSTIPTWMFLTWGMILCFVATFSRWQGLNPPASPSNRIGIGSCGVESAPIKVASELCLVFLTRQTIYRHYLDPTWSWLPFLAALAVFLLFFSPVLHDLKLLAIFLVGGPLVEMLYIHAGGLHHYHLGWIGGVPLWIILWWGLIVLVWKDIARRIEACPLVQINEKILKRGRIMKERVTISTLFLAVSLVVFAAGCGGGSTSSENLGTPPISHNGSISAFGNNFYQFTTGAGVSYTISLTNTQSDLSWELFSDPFNTSVMRCDNSPGLGPDNETCATPVLPAGTIYYLAVYEWEDVSGTFTLTITR